MSTTVVTAIDMDKLNAFIGQFVTDLGASVHTGMVVIGEKLGLYKALAGEALTSAQLAAFAGQPNPPSTLFTKPGHDLLRGDDAPLSLGE
jgi:hypothetical protein